MESTPETRQAHRVSVVSDSLDSLPREQAAATWNAARDLYAKGECSFLTAFELSLPRYNDDVQ